MGGTKCEAGRISRYYDAYGEREWERFAASPADRVSLHLHRRYLRQYVRPGDRVLEAGAGPGRFTIELARIGAAITVGDISPGQLAINAEKVAAAGGEGRVVERAPLDIVDLARFPDGGFDAVVCYGGPLSYVFDRADDALAGLLRVTRPGGARPAEREVAGGGHGALPTGGAGDRPPARPRGGPGGDRHW